MLKEEILDPCVNDDEELELEDEDEEEDPEHSEEQR